MRNRLCKRERDAVLERYRNDVLFKWMNRSARALEREMRRFRFSVEELFLEVMDILDRVKESPRDAREECADMWNTLFCRYRDMDTADAEDAEIELAVLEVIYVSQHLLGMLGGYRYASLCLQLAGQISQNSAEGYGRMMNVFVPEMYKLKEETLRARVEAYMQDDDEWISDNICDMLDALPDEVHRKVDGSQVESSAASGDQLTNRQLIILFESLMNVGLSSQFTNIKALSRLISRVSGRSEGSIRTAINNGIDYDSATVRNDAQVVVELLDRIDHSLADRVRRNIEE